MLQAVILAAGNSQRFNGIKQLALLHKQPILQHAILSYYENQRLLAGISGLTVVLGANEALIKAQIKPTADCFFAANWQQGMGSSLAGFVTQLHKDTSHLLIGLGDQVALQANDIKCLLTMHQHNPEAIVSAKYNEILGAPSIFPRKYFQELACLQGDKGAKSLLLHHHQHVISVDLPNATFDIDTQQDLRWAEEYLSK
jgi:molybdenum cofactor cytidylyltransferase